MECPICEHTGLEKDVATCHSCNADLSAYHAIDAIEVSLKKQKRNTLLFMILFIVALLACVAIFFLSSTEGTSKEDEQKLIDCETLVEDLKTENQQLKQSLAEMETKNAQMLEVKVEEPIHENITHVIKDGETLFIIAKNYLGNGDLYSKIAQDNGIEDPNLIFPGKEIIIKK